MTTAAIALMAALAAIVVAGLVAAMGRRTRAASETRITSALREMGTRMDDLAHELTASMERLHEEGRRARAIEALGQSLDLDEVLGRVTDAAAALPGADASVVRVHPDGTEPLVAAAGVGLGTASAQEITGPPDGTRVRAVALSYHYPAVDPPDDPLRSAIAVPLEVDGTDVGFLAVYARGEGTPVGPEDFGTLEAIASHAGPAIENARRFGEARRLSTLDALTGLANRSTFHETLALELDRARRHLRRLAVIVLDIDGFQEVNAEIGHLGGDTVLSELAGILRASARPSDLACRIGGDELAVILPDSGRVEAEALFARVQATLRRMPPTGVSALTVSGGIAEVEESDDAISLFHRAEEALLRAKRHGRGSAA